MTALRCFLALALIGIAMPVWAACRVATLATLPVTMAGTRPIIHAKINGADVRLVADSGAFYSVITPVSAAELGLKTTSLPGYRVGGVGGSAAASMATVKTFTLAGVDIPNVEFIVAGSEVGGTGVLGQNILNVVDVEYDLAAGVIRLMRPDGCEKANLAYWAAGKPVSLIETNRVSRAEPHIIGPVYLNGVKLRAVFDTGASGSILTLRAAARAGVKPGDPGVAEAGLSSGIGRRPIQTWIAPFASFKFGGEEIRRARLRIGDLGLPNADMLVGVDFFLSHRVYMAKKGELFFTYNGGPVFNLAGDRQGGAARPPVPLSDGAVDGRAEPTDADGFARRGAAFASRRDLDRAIADLTRACEMAPNEPRYFYMRATMRMAARQPFLARADLDRVLSLRPDDLPALAARAELKLAGNEREAALADLDAAAGLAPPMADARMIFARMYDRAGATDKALAQFDLWIANHPQDSRRAEALNGRCWLRALSGRELDKALEDCNAAVRLVPKMSAPLDSRGLVQLRRGDFARSIADYDAALAIKPNSVWSLYGRGIAKMKSGNRAEGEADVAKAISIDPKMSATGRRYGVTP